MFSESASINKFNRIKPKLCIARLPSDMDVRRFGKIGLKKADAETSDS
jgi:hypothetical protein